MSPHTVAASHVGAFFVARKLFYIAQQSIYTRSKKFSIVLEFQFQIGKEFLAKAVRILEIVGANGFDIFPHNLIGCFRWSNCFDRCRLFGRRV